MALGSLLSAKDAPDLMETLAQTIDKLASVDEALDAQPPWGALCVAGARDAGNEKWNDPRNTIP